MENKDAINDLLSIIVSLGDGVYRLDTKGNYKKVWATGECGVIFGAPGMSGSLHDHFSQEMAGAFLENIHKAISGSQTVEMEFPFVESGTEKWFLAKITPLKENAGSDTEEVVAFIREITREIEARRQAEFKNRLIDQLTSINNGPVLHIIKCEQLEFGFIAGNLPFLTGYTPTELADIGWRNIIYGSDRDDVLKNLKKLCARKGEFNESLVYRIVTKDGDIHWITNQLSKSGDDHTDTFFGVMFNITEIQLLNQQLKQRDRILTNSGRVAKIAGWEFDLKTDQINFTDEIYDLFDVEKDQFDIRKGYYSLLDEDAPQLQHHLDNLIKYGKKYDIELPIKTKKGVTKWIRSVGSAEWQGKQLTHVFGVVQDISERKEKDLILQQSERRFDAAFELAPIGIGLVSPEGKWIKVNMALSNFFEFSPEMQKEIPHGNVELHQDLKKVWKSVNQPGNNKPEIHQFEDEYTTQTGKVKWGRLSINSVRDEQGNVLYFIFQMVDITTNKEAEKKLMVAKKEAEAATKAKADFLSTMSHEIRTPLYGVIGMTNLLLEEIRDPHQMEKLHALKFSSDSLLLIVNDILDYSKIKSGALKLESKPFVLEKLVDAVKESNIQRANELGNKIIVNFDKRLPQKVIGDKLRVGQILNNLVSNAVKFTKKGTVEISVRLKKKAKDWYTIEFSVKDNGIGIPKNMHSAIFEQFTQAESGTTRKYGGTGLGLSIVRGLLSSMGSEAHLTSKVGKGTEINFELLLRGTNSLPESKNDNGSETVKNLRQKTILLVEDNPVSKMVANDFIKKWNGNILVAENGLEAVETFVQHMDKIDLVLMDLQMPIMNGFEATRQIKTISPQIPIIALTASIGDKSILDSLDHGMSAYLTKPFHPDDFYKLIKQYL
ncbi:MAG TPA: PAS domain S-box protein [Cyclobacteriaceae bacterium]|nr:PAS domain S-box protein [Cyclobacteriaceae bacterium]